MKVGNNLYSKPGTANKSTLTRRLNLHDAKLTTGDGMLAIMLISDCYKPVRAGEPKRVRPLNRYALCLSEIG